MRSNDHVALKDKHKMASLLKSVFGPSPNDSKPSGVETVQKICHRITSSTMIEDRRDALRAIKGMSRQYRKEVGDLCLNVLLEAIKNDRGDSESVSYAVEAILNVLLHEEGDENSTTEQLLGVKYANEIMKNIENVTLILSLVDEFDFSIRLPTVKLLTLLLSLKMSQVQDAILSSPMGISKIMDLLGAKQEVIRNETLLLLSQLTRSNSQIQKIVAFESAFERLMSIVQDEGYSDGSIIVEDCITIMTNLLRGNSSNQAFYREANQIQSLVPFFDFKLSSSIKWSDQKIANVLSMLILIRTLLSPGGNSQQNVSACQKVIHQCRLLSLLCAFMFASGVPTPVLVESINTVSEAIRGNFVNQQYFDTVETPSQPPRSGILTILMCMVNEKQPLPLRLAALYCFQSYLYKNEVGQNKVINTLLPSSTETTVSAGQVLCAGLFGTDPLSIWTTAMGLSCSLSPSLKPQLLRVQLSMQGKGQITLLQQCSDILVKTPDLNPLSRVGLLILLSTWLYDCPLAVTSFLDNSVNIPFLTGMIEQHYNNEQDQILGGLCAMIIGICLVYNDGGSPGYSVDTLKQIITRRISQDSFTQSLSQVTSTELFIQASKQPQTLAGSVQQVCFDYQFTILYRQVCNAILKALDPSIEGNEMVTSVGERTPSQNNLSQLSTSFDEHNSVVKQYKDLLQEQDRQIMELKKNYSQLQQDRSEDQMMFQRKLQEAAILSQSKNSLQEGGVTNGEREGGSEVESLKEANTSLQRVQESLRQELGQKNALVEQLRQNASQLQDRLQSLENNDLLKLKEKINQLKIENEALLTEKSYLDAQLESRLREEERGGGDSMTQEMLELKQQLQSCQEMCQELKVKNETLEKEQEDLLVLLADNDSRIKKCRELLKSNNIDFPESEEEEEEESDSDDEL